MHTDSRILACIDTLVAASERMRASLEQVDDDIAARPAAGGWSPAQIAYHVGVTNERFFLPAFTGAAPFMVSAPEGFTESFSFDSLPARVKTIPPLEPPAVTKAEAIEKLRASAAHLATAMQEMPPGRLTHCARLQFGTLSIQQMAEFAAAHVVRHQQQLDRAVGGAS
jgi:hypothetical protein